MLPAQHRLARENDFQYLFRRGRPYFTRHLTLKVVANRQPMSRFGVVVSAKISKKSVVRNRLKRRLRHVIGQRLANIQSGYDIILIPKASCIDLKHSILTENVDFLLKKARLQP